MVACLYQPHTLTKNIGLIFRHSSLHQPPSKLHSPYLGFCLFHSSSEVSMVRALAQPFCSISIKLRTVLPHLLLF